MSFNLWSDVFNVTKEDVIEDYRPGKAWFLYGFLVGLFGGITPGLLGFLWNHSKIFFEAFEQGRRKYATDGSLPLGLL